MPPGDGSPPLEWDERKNRANVRKHGVDFRDVVYGFSDPDGLSIPDAWDSEDEERWELLGRGADANLLVVVHTDRRHGAIQLISARLATRKERAVYEQRLRR